ncbi:hypothetical protein E4U42_005958 [Claviceps africana]|uniref:1,3-beta-glucanosyltransferase n=1 Tax=Claviceps africana TaxID=83212 RepID=A0A8K0J5U6_9HYPO|nr:hypothetical protein E4U42_005958 [Claviceps africana]
MCHRATPQMHAALVALSASLVAAVPPLEIVGNEIYNPETGNKFEVVGIAYQPGGSAGFSPTSPDPLSQPEACKRDAALMQAIGVNAIRVYNLNPDLNHDECASIFNAAGIYMMLDVNSPLPGQSLWSSKPWETYNAGYLNHTFAVVEAFGNYPNTLLFFSGNEVINDVSTGKNVPKYLRAVTRDLKNYIKNNLKRKIFVGYSAADVRPVLWDTWNFMQCSDGKDDMTRSDLFALNSYSWCGIAATFESSTYKDLVDGLAKSSIPVFFSEYGCNVPAPRYWNETRTIYSDKMMGSLQGGVVYEWNEEANDYGLISVKGDVLSILGDYDRLKAAWATIDWKKVQSQKAHKKEVTPPACKASLITQKGFDTDFNAPKPPPGAQKLIDEGISSKPVGKIVKISDYNVKLTVKDSKGKQITGLKVARIPKNEFNVFGRNPADTDSSADDEDTDSSGSGSGSDDKGSGSGSGSSGSDDKGKDKGSKDKGNGGTVNTPATLAMLVPLAALLFV